MNKLLLHIGYHKTATTWLQTQLFDNADIGFTRTHTRHAVPQPIVLPHALDFDPASCRAHFEGALQAARGAGLLPVLSHERLSGEIHTGGRDSKEIADRLHATFPEAHVLIVIREQRAIIASIYSQFIKGSGVWPLCDYLEPPRSAKYRFKYELFHLEHFRYHRLIAYYQHLFGRDRVTVLPYELFGQQPHDFVGRIVREVGLPVDPQRLSSLPYTRIVNPSLSALGLEIKRWLNRSVGRRTPFNTTPLIPLADPKKRLRRVAFAIDRRLPERWKVAADRRMAEQIESVVRGFYCDSNRQTAALTALPLADLGYEM